MLEIPLRVVEMGERGKRGDFGEVEKTERLREESGRLREEDVVEIQGATVGGGNQHGEEVDQVEDIMALTAPPVSTTEVVVLNATPVSSTIGKETLDGCHVAEVTPPSPAMAF